MDFECLQICVSCFAVEQFAGVSWGQKTFCPQRHYYENSNAFIPARYLISVGNGSDSIVCSHTAKMRSILDAVLNSYFILKWRN